MANKLLKKIQNAFDGEVLPGAVKSGAEAGQQVLKLAKALDQNRNVKELQPLIVGMSSLLDVLNSPLVQIAGETLPFGTIAVDLIKLFCKITHHEPTMEECVELVSQAAYLESLRNFLKNPDNQSLYDQLLSKHSSKVINKRIKALGDMSDHEVGLGKDDTIEILTCFHESKLATNFNSILSARLIEAGLSEDKAKITTERVSRNTYRYLKPTLLEMHDDIAAVKALVAAYASNWGQDLEEYQSIDKYLEEVIAEKPRDKVFRENFSFKDIYVSQKAKSIKGGKQEEPFDLEEWALDALQDREKQGQVLFIQGGPGRGKSVFCRMFADRVRRELYPIWTPVLIELRKIRDVKPEDFEEMLRKGVDRTFSKDSAWLNDRNVRYLFILDGFDELLFERGSNRGLGDFLRRVATFQINCKDNREKQHRLLVTGRDMALHGLDPDWPNKDVLERVEIVLMDNDIQNAWLANYAKVMGEETISKLQRFLESQHCPAEVKQLAREPLLIYLLARMYRDGYLSDGTFEKVESATVGKLQIYEETLEWVLTKQRPDDLNVDLTDLEIGDLRRILLEVGLCVVQSGEERTTRSLIEQRLKQKTDESAIAFLKDHKVQVVLATFYTRSVPEDANSIEFIHKSFGEFLFAKRLWESLDEWSRPGDGNRQYTLGPDDLVREIYDLLGYGCLSPEIVEYLSAILRQKSLHQINLFERLKNFYFRWSNGTFIEYSLGTTKPQEKAVTLSFPLQRAVDIYTGLNVLILLLELYRYAQTDDRLKEKIVFHPCGPMEQDGESNDRRLFSIISYASSYPSDSDYFISHLRTFLHDSNLSNVYLAGKNLYGANLSNTNLSNAVLNRVNLHQANLSGADCNNASFLQANLGAVNLSNANLSNAILIRVDLERANLCGARLKDSNLRGAILKDILWDSNTKWLNAEYLHETFDIPEKLRQESEFSIAILLSEGLSLAKAGKIKEAIYNYKQVEDKIAILNEAPDFQSKLEISAKSWAQLGYLGCLHGFAQDVMPACEKAVLAASHLPEDGIYSVGRGLARARTGDYAGAIEDLQAVFDSGELSDADASECQSWLESLREGNNPFTDEKLEALLRDEE